MKLFKSGPSKELVLAFEQVGGGVHKRTDENRELMELLQDKAPHFLAKYPWAIGWLQNHDDFFTAYAGVSGAVTHKELKLSGISRASGGERGVIHWMPFNDLCFPCKRG